MTISISVLLKKYSQMTTNHLDGLNEEQKEAVLHQNGPILVLAGAGAGKTKVLVSRIINLIHSGISPENILAITFTNKAAGEMKERVRASMRTNDDLNRPVLGAYYDKSTPFVSTFHSLGVYILRNDGPTIGIPKTFKIYDRGDALSAIRESMKKLGIGTKEWAPSKIQSIISKQKGKNIGIDAFEEDSLNPVISRIVVPIWREYENILQKEKSLDFDDLLGKTLLLLENENIRKKYQTLWQHIHIDEYQDTNPVQYEIAMKLVGKEKNIFVVGDGDQCLHPDTKIQTTKGLVKINKIKPGNVIVSAAGNSNICQQQVTGVMKHKYNGDLLYIKTKSGRKINITPDHLVFASLSINSNSFYTYLMYKKSKGYRIGIAKSIRSDGQKLSIGLQIRSNQEHADKMWVLKVSTNKGDARYWEYYYSYKYGIPSLVFSTGGRKMQTTQKQIDLLFKEIPTEERVTSLFKEEHLLFDYPHYTPQGTTNTNSQRGRTNVNLVMFGDKRKSLQSPWGLSRVSINTSDMNLKKKLFEDGFKIRKGKRKDWRLEISRLDYADAENIAQKILNIDKHLTIKRVAKILEAGRLDFMPAGSLRKSMSIARYDKKSLVVDEIIEISRKKYSGYVYDLNVENTHNYIAEGIAVHNCIYSWRGAEIANILDFENDFPNSKVVKLEKNYRSTKNILRAAQDVIEKNTLRKEKTLFTDNEDGDKISILYAYDEADEANTVAEKIVELQGGGTKFTDIAILYRTNFQSRALEEAMIAHEIPYHLLGTRFFERKEIKDMLAYIRLGVDHESVADIRRVINVPKRGIGKVSLAKIVTGKTAELSPKIQKDVASFYSFVHKISAKIDELKPSELVCFVYEATGIKGEFEKGSDEEKERGDNIGELVTLAVKYDTMAPRDGVMRLLDDVALLSDQDSLEGAKNGVRLMTVHASKGLEFDVVFVTGLEDGLFPQAREDMSIEEEEEERRLFYVAITRAKKKVFLAQASMRTIFGSRTYNLPSKFLEEIGEDVIETEEVKRIKTVYLD